MKNQKVIVLGGGFAGVSAINQLDKRCDVTLIDRKASFEWAPNIHEIVSGIKTPELLSFGLDKIAQSNGHGFVQVDVERVDLDSQLIDLSSGVTLDYDALIVCLGNQTNYFSVPGAENFSFAYKTIEDAIKVNEAICKRVQMGLETTVTVIGGGFTGIEVMGELVRRYGGLDGFELNLIEKRSHLLNEKEVRVSDSLLELCENNGVNVRLNSSIVSVSDESIFLSNDKKIKSDINIWTAGMEPSLLELGGKLQPTSNGFSTNESLQLESYPNVFIAGDIASTLEKPSKQAYHAMEMGKLAAKNCMAMFEGQPIKRFSPQPELSLLSFGHLNTYVISDHGVFSSPLLAPLKETIFQLQMTNLSKGLPLSDSLFALVNRYVNSLKRLAIPELLRIKPARVYGASRLLRVGSSTVK